MRTILLAVVGLSPQVVTETLYALFQEGRRVDEIHLLTTGDGRHKILATLLAGQAGAFRSFLQDYGIPAEKIMFNENNVHVLTDENGKALSDITGVGENERFLELCLERTFSLTQISDTAVFFSIAGGRKTMSACLAAAAQLYGRRQDRMYHVLVSPEFESTPDFFYPPPTSELLQLTSADGTPYFKETRYATVTLVPIPFVSIREQLAPEWLETPHPPATLMSTLVKDPQPILVVDLSACVLRYRQMEVDLTPAQMALYVFFVRRRIDCPTATHTKGCPHCFISVNTLYEHQAELTDIYRGICGTRPIEEMSDTGITALSQENFNSYKSKIRSRILRGLGLQAMTPLAIQSVDTRPKRYGIVIDKAQIHYEPG
jgi:CRISPR-associated protein (TIGR02584 family)